jgi:hypothetical protein
MILIEGSGQFKLFQALHGKEDHEKGIARGARTGELAISSDDQKPPVMNQTPLDE